MKLTRYALAAIAASTLAATGAAMAEMTPGGISLQPAESLVAQDVHFFHNVVLMPIITAISLFVLGLLLWVIVRFNSKANPTPQKFSHNTLVEIVWTVIPVMILVIIALPSFDLLYKEDVTPDGKQTVVAADGAATQFAFDNDFPDRRMARRAEHIQVLLSNGNGVSRLKHKADYRLDGLGEAQVVVAMNEAPPAGSRVIIRGGQSTENVAGCGAFARYFDFCEKNIALAPTMTLKVNGYQWGWAYSYPDFGDFEFASNMVAQDLTIPGDRLEVDNRVVVPVGETIRVTTTARDVIHSWAMPVFALKIDAVPGRINETWFKAEREGVFYGQCSEICGVKHSFMPIAIEVVSRADFEAWVDSQRALAGMEPMFGEDVKLAQAE